MCEEILEHRPYLYKQLITGGDQLCNSCGLFHEGNYFYCYLNDLDFEEQKRDYDKRIRLKSLLSLSEQAIETNWKFLSSEEKDYLINNRKFSFEYCVKYQKYFGMKTLLRTQDFPEWYLETLKDNWKYISRFQKLSIEFVERNFDKIDWKKLVFNDNFGIGHIKHFFNHILRGDLKFQTICALDYRKDLYCDELFDIIDRENFDVISKRYRFTKEQLVKYKDKIHLGSYSKENKYFIKDVKFYEDFGGTPFDHGKLIKSGKLTKEYCLENWEHYKQHFNNLCWYFNFDENFILKNKKYINNHCLGMQIVKLINPSLKIFEFYFEEMPQYLNYVISYFFKFDNKEFEELQNKVLHSLSMNARCCLKESKEYCNRINNAIRLMTL